MAISAAKRKANRKNARKSTGPRTTAGKNAVRFNSVTHGGTAKTPVLPWEDGARFAQRILGYKTWLRPEGDLENSLVEEMALTSVQQERLVRSELARITYNIHTSRAEEMRIAEEQAMALGQRLFFDQHGPLALHPRPESVSNEPRLVWSKTADDPDHPSRLVMALERTGAGVRWLLARWTELRSRVEANCWDSSREAQGGAVAGQTALRRRRRAASRPDLLMLPCARPRAPRRPLPRRAVPTWKRRTTRGSGSGS